MSRNEYDDLGQGIFSPLFEQSVLDEAERSVVAGDRARDEKRAGSDVSIGFRTRQILAEEAEQVARHEARQKMLLVERLWDELPETIALLRDRLLPTPASLRHRARRSMERAVGAVERKAAHLASMVAIEVYEERMKRVETLTKLGRERPRSVTDPVNNASWRDGEFDPAPATPESNAANDLFDQLMSKVRPALRSLRRHLSRIAPSEDPQEE